MCHHSDPVLLERSWVRIWLTATFDFEFQQLGLWVAMNIINSTALSNVSMSHHSFAGPDPHRREGLDQLQRHSCSAQSACRPLFKYLLITLYHPQIMEVSFITCNLLKHTLDKVSIGFHAQNFTQNCTQPCFPHS